MKLFQPCNCSWQMPYALQSLDKSTDCGVAKKYSKEEVMKSYKSIMKKIHPDVSPELSRLASIVNEAKDVVIKSIDI